MAYRERDRTDGQGLVQRSQRTNRDDDGLNGEAESLWQRISIEKMGDRAHIDTKEKQGKSNEEAEQDVLPRKKTTLDAVKRPVIRQQYKSVLDVDDGVAQRYQPRIDDTRVAYETLLATVAQMSADDQFVTAMTDEVLSLVKQAQLDVDQDLALRLQVESVVGAQVSDAQLQQLVQICQQITDYQLPSAGDDGEMPNQSVAVVFEEENQSDDEDEQDAIIDAAEPVKDTSDVEEFDDLILLAGIEKTEKDDVNAEDISDAWFSQLLSQHITDAVSVHRLSPQIIKALGTESARDCENQLVELFEFQHELLVKMLVKNRQVIYWGLVITRAQSDEERDAVVQQMSEAGQKHLLKRFGIKQHDQDKTMADLIEERAPTKLIDLDSLVFAQGSHTMTNKKCVLPEGSYKNTRPLYEEIVVPAPKPVPFASAEKLVTISTLPEWMHVAFQGAKSLNRIQSRLFPVAYGSDENLLLCAPTGAGKTNVAMLTILNELVKHRDAETRLFNLNAFKIVYIAPMKALVQEMVGNFGARLAPYGVQVQELTGDRQMTMQQIADTQIIVTTPEKWDIITRKGTDRSYTLLVRLVIIDEIHLLHDYRGPVLESIVARTIRQIEQTRDSVRIVGLSATLPNYTDVAAFLRVDLQKGLFHFDNAYRPCPLQTTYIGITERKPLKRNQIMNDVVYEKSLDQAGKNQTIVFVHSRKDTAKTAKALRDKAVEQETIGQFLKRDSPSREILQQEANRTKNSDLQDLLPYGFGIHHAGMSRADRTLVEELFADKHIQVLVSTATLAWGVNLPAHSVIIKGTQVYSPEKGKWIELSPQDVLQMLGRAGRPQYDTFGEGTIITTHGELQFYLSLLNTQLPIESQFMAKLADMLNAEVVLGSVKSRDDAIDWLGYTYLFIRMLRSPGVYGVSDEERETDPFLDQKRVDLVHTAATLLHKCHLIKYDVASGKMQSTELGKIASYYYISHTSMQTYNQNLRPSMSLMDLMRVFALSDEFKFIPVRAEEKVELQQLIERVPVPVKETADEPVAKINVLLQAYISQLSLDGFNLMADMVYITQSAGRLMRAIFEICLRREWAHLAKKALELCKMIDRRIWLSMTPLRQIRGVNQDLLKRLERKEFNWSRMHDLSPIELGELVRNPKAGKLLHKLVHQIPKLDIQLQAQPITQQVLQVDLVITPDFMFDKSVHNPGGELFWILVEDCDGERILYQDQYVLRPDSQEDEYYVSFTVPLSDPMPPNYFVSVVSDRWLHADFKSALSFRNLVLPTTGADYTELSEDQLRPVSELGILQFIELFQSRGITHLSPVQSQAFDALYKSDENVLVCSSGDCNKHILYELAIMRHWSIDHGDEDAAAILFITQNAEVANQRFVQWREVFMSWDRAVAVLTGVIPDDLKAVQVSDLIIATAEQWEPLSRLWRNRKSIQTIGLVIVEDMHMLASAEGANMEIVSSRTRFMANQLENPPRVVVFAESLYNAHDVGSWLGCTQIFNFNAEARRVPLEIHMQSFNVPQFASQMIAMYKPAVDAYKQHCLGLLCIVVTPDKSHARKFATYASTVLRQDSMQVDVEFDDAIQPLLLANGIGLLHESLTEQDFLAVLLRHQQQQLQMLVVSRSVAHRLYSRVTGDSLTAHLVIIMNTQFRDQQQQYLDYPVAEVLHWCGVASQTDDTNDCGKVMLMVPQQRKQFYKQFLHEGLPVESMLDQQAVAEYLTAELQAGTIANKQDAVDMLTYTLLFRRLPQNPNFYGVTSRDPQLISDYMSDLVEAACAEMVELGTAAVAEDGFTLSVAAANAEEEGGQQ